MIKLQTFDLLDKELTREVDEFLKYKDEVRWDMSGIEFKLDPVYWDRFYPEISKHTFNWEEFKFSNFPNLDKKIPTDDVGIYLFVVKAPNLIINLPQYVLYVGISGEGGSNRPLKQRLNDYYYLGQIKKRNKLHRLLKRYYNHVYIKYSLMPGISSSDLEQLEEDFHGFFIPPAGDRDFPADIKQLKKSQWTR